MTLCSVEFGVEASFDLQCYLRSLPWGEVVKYPAIFAGVESISKLPEVEFLLMTSL